MHALPKDETVRKKCVQQILKGRKDLKSEDIPNNCLVCLNHLFDERPTKSNPSPSLLLTVSTNTVPTPKKRNFMAPFYGWGSTTSRLEPRQGGSLLFTTKSPEIHGTHFINLRRIKG